MVTVDDMRVDDLAHIEWSGGPTHLKNVAGQLVRRDRDGAVEYLVVRGDDADGGRPLSKAAIDYEEHPGAGTIMQVCTRADLCGRGYARMLMEAAEARIRARGLSVARLGVEPDNERARRLYEWLGYAEVGTRSTGWEQEDPTTGAVVWYSTVVVEMEKAL